MIGSFCTIYTLYDFLKAINYLKKCWIDRNAFFHSLCGFTFCVSRRKPRGRRRSAAGLHRPAKPVWEAMGDGYRRLRRFAFHCTGSCLRCRKNDFFGICGVGMVSHMLRYYFAPFIRFEMIRKERAPLREVFLRSGTFSYHFLGYCKGCYTDIWYVIFACGDKYLMVTITWWKFFLYPFDSINGE